MKIISGFNLKSTFSTRLFVSIFLLSAPVLLFAQADSVVTAGLKKLTLEDLMDMEVTSVSKRPEKLNEAASAVQVITQRDIRNSGAKTLPEALRLAPNLQVAQVNASQWAISARGFNNVLANKLLVLIDGRSVYTPLYAGVYWDVQNVLLEDIDRIEVISGPGGTLWGANAVNGVINIITKSSKDTQGLFVEAATGSAMPASGGLRYGAKLVKNLSYKVYGTGFKIGNTLQTTGEEANDEWGNLQGGLQLDWNPSDQNQLTLQQNAYNAHPNPEGGSIKGTATGNNVLLRWSHRKSERFDFQLQLYYDYTKRRYPELVENLKTYDIDWHNKYLAGRRHTLSFGAGFRLMDHEVNNLPLFKFLPANKNLYLYDIFLQDEISLIDDRLKLTLGAKAEHNTYTGFEYQPNGRLTFTPANNHTLWVAVSRAVKTPSRLDRDVAVYLDANSPLLVGSDEFISETLVAYELGWRSQPRENLSFSLSTFFNKYDNIRSAEPPAPPAQFPAITLGNGVKGEAYGLELAAGYQLNDWWNIRGGYTFVKKELSLKPGSKDLNKASAESNDPKHQILLQSNIILPAGLEFGTVFRYIDKLPQPVVAAYSGVDIRLGYHITKGLEINVVGQNLLDESHREFIPSSPSPRLIERSVYGKITWRY